MKVYSTEEIEQLLAGISPAYDEPLTPLAHGDRLFAAASPSIVRQLLTRVAELEEEQMRLKKELSDAIKTAEKHYDNSIREMQRATGKQEAVQRMKEALINKMRKISDECPSCKAHPHLDPCCDACKIARSDTSFYIAELEKVKTQ
jgi:hypothetical protein